MECPKCSKRIDIEIWQNEKFNCSHCNVELAIKINKINRRGAVQRYLEEANKKEK